MSTVNEILIYRQRQKEKMEQHQQEIANREENRQAMMLTMAKLHLDEGLSYAEIGRRYKLTRQRVHQLMKEFAAGPVADLSTTVADQSLDSLNASEETPSSPSPDFDVQPRNILAS